VSSQDVPVSALLMYALTLIGLIARVKPAALAATRDRLDDDEQRTQQRLASVRSQAMNEQVTGSR
jgi:hypothetical protein